MSGVGFEEFDEGPGSGGPSWRPAGAALAILALFVLILLVRTWLG